MLVLTGDSSGLQLILVLLLSILIRQIHLWRDRAIFVPPPSGQVYSDTLQGLLEESIEEMVPY
jgi:hypothetical protein